MENKQINLTEEEDKEVENILASIYTIPFKTDLYVTDETPLYKPKSENNDNNIKELDKTTIIERIIDLPDTNFKTDELSIDDEPYKPEDFDKIPNPNIEKRLINTRETRIRDENRKRRKRKQAKRTFLHIFSGVLLIVFIVSVSAFFSYYIIKAALDFTGIITTDFDVEIEIPEHSTTEEIAEILYKNGIINMPELFIIYSRMSGADGKYLNGLFTISSSMSYSSIVSTLQKVSKVTETVNVRLREGMTASEIGILLEENFVCKASDFEYFYKNKQNKYNFEKRVLINSKKYYQLEGYLFPDTYEFFVVDELVEGKEIDTSSYAEMAASKIYSNFNSKISKEMYKRINEMGFTLDEFITLSSMVQAEAGTIEDMYMVASVFINRLRNSGTFPKLQSDVTILYVENNIKPNVNSKNEGIYTPIIKAYNTYETDGLPPGPICNPGLDAMNAVLEAPETGYYYFCANEETLEMFYATTIQEHEHNLILAGLA